MTTSSPLVLSHPVLPKGRSNFSVTARDGGRALARMGQRFGGVSLLTATVVLALIPLQAPDMAAVLCKIMVIVVMAFAGLALWQAGRPVSVPELEIDLVRREVRLVRWAGTKRRLIRRRRFSELSRARIRGRVLQLWDEADALLAEVSVSDQGYLRNLRRGLQNEGVAV